MRKQLEQDIKTALLSGDSQKSQALKFIKNAVDLAEKQKNSELTEEEIISLMRKEVKKREEAAELFARGGNSASAEKERYEADLIREYLPPEASEEAIRARVEQIIADQNIPKEVSSMGRIIGAVSADLGASADKSVIARITSEILKG